MGRSIHVGIVFGILVVVGCSRQSNSNGPMPSDLQNSNQTNDRELRAQVHTLLRPIHGEENTISDQRSYSDRPFFRITFRKPGPTDAEFANLVTELKAIPFDFHFYLDESILLTPVALENLKGAAHIKGISLGKEHKEKAFVSNLARLDHLVELSLSSDEIVDSDLAALSKLKQLQFLSIYSKKATADAYRHLADLTNLRELRGLPEPGDKGLPFMKGMSKLEELTLFYGASLEGLASLKGMTGMRKLNIALGDAKKEQLTNLVAMKNLEELWIGSNTTTDDALVPIGGLTNLKKLTCEHMKDAALKDLSGLTNLEDLCLSDSKVSGAGFEYLQGLTKLKSLNMHGSPVADEGLKHLKAFSNLKRLDLFGSNVTGKGLSALAGLPNLELLVLSESKIDDEGLKGMVKLPKLKELFLSKTKITDVGLIHLAQIRSLTRLNLDENDISDLGLTSLSGLSELWILDLRKTKVTDEGVKKFKQTLPRADILIDKESR